MKILIVETHDEKNDAVAKYLSDLGIQISWANSLRDAASIDHDFDIILMDVGESGSCSLEVVKFFIETAQSPTIVITDNPELLNDCQSSFSKTFTAVRRSDMAKELKYALVEVLSAQLKSV